MRAVFISILFAVMRLSLIPKKRRFKNKLLNPKRAQDRALDRIIADTAKTEFGFKNCLSKGDLYGDFARKVPISTYEDLKPWVERQADSANKVLLSDKIPFYEKTSGSSGAYKLIPYTEKHLRSFHHMFLLWFEDVISNGPKFKAGKIFVSISPFLFIPESSEKNIQIGLENDEDYLPEWLQFLFKSFWVLPPKVAKLRSASSFKRIAALYLLTSDDLEAVLVWSPSFFTNLLDYIDRNRDKLLQDLDASKIVEQGLEFHFKKPNMKLRATLSSNEPIAWAAFWPSLKFISCWDNALAFSSANYLRRLFPNALVQGKGLLATEGVMTLPLILARGFVPLLDSVFFEFEREDGRLMRLHELTENTEYQIICSFPGGFTRYRIGDIVRVTHFYQNTPCFEFVGRAGMVSDVVGEKLTEPFVQKVFSELPLSDSRFQLLFPVLNQKRPYYRLILDHFKGELEHCERLLDSLLQKSHRYKAARLIGQLDAVKITVNPDAEGKYMNYFVNKGMKSGNVKHRFLFNKPIDDLMVANEFAK